ncbi:MAG TPA: hypothetical protein PLH02_05125 [Bacillota bacterium]|nr:hypothetical protein [Bacillota bacterium]HPJ86159.1 hypothetical protein [Bacillota bacterium]HPQ62230.1 hypothetical protein [Bacillota bacterium]
MKRKMLVVILTIAVFFMSFSSITYVGYSYFDSLSSNSQITLQIGEWTMAPDEWDPTLKYDKGDQVTYNGVIYEAFRNVPANRAPDSFRGFFYWYIVS